MIIDSPPLGNCSDPTVQHLRDRRAAALIAALAPAIQAVAGIDPKRPPWHPQTRRAGQLLDRALDALADEMVERLCRRLVAAGPTETGANPEGRAA